MTERSEWIVYNDEETELDGKVRYVPPRPDRGYAGWRAHSGKGSLSAPVEPDL